MGSMLKSLLGRYAIFDKIAIFSKINIMIYFWHTIAVSTFFGEKYLNHDNIVPIRGWQNATPGSPTRSGSLRGLPAASSAAGRRRASRRRRRRA
jgi:hypothetical protein